MNTKKSNELESNLIVSGLVWRHDPPPPPTASSESQMSEKASNLIVISIAPLTPTTGRRLIFSASPAQAQSTAKSQTTYDDANTSSGLCWPPRYRSRTQVAIANAAWKPETATNDCQHNHSHRTKRDKETESLSSPPLPQPHARYHSPQVHSIFILFF